eukprot:6182883-Pleurochrysis_carterae.AAC.2
MRACACPRACAASERSGEGCKLHLRAHACFVCTQQRTHARDAARHHSRRDAHERANSCVFMHCHGMNVQTRPCVRACMRTLRFAQMYDTRTIWVLVRNVETHVRTCPPKQQCCARVRKSARGVGSKGSPP